MSENNVRKITAIDKNTDFDNFFELSRISFGENISVDKQMYDWYFNQNPYNPAGTNMMYVLKEYDSSKKSDKIIASDGLFPFELCVQGVKYKAAYSVESMTHPDYKRQGIFKAMTENSLAKAKEHGLDIVLGLANINSYGPYQKFGWKTLFEKRIYVRPICIKNRLKRKLPIKFLAGIISSSYSVFDNVRRNMQAGKAKGYISEISDLIPDYISKCFEMYKDKYHALIVRDATYLDYRYNKRPDKKYKTIFIKKDPNGDDSQIEGFAVVRICSINKNPMLSVAEFFCNPDDENAVNALLKAIVDYAYDNDAEYMVLCVGGNLKIKNILAKNGFALNKKPLVNNMMVACDVSGKIDMDMLVGEERWMITQGDGESELHF